MRLIIGDLDLFCSGDDRDAWRERLTHAIDGGRARPQWCFTLVDDDGAVLAAVSYWAPRPGVAPVLAWHLDPGADPRHGAEVLRRSAPTLGASRLVHDILTPAGSRPDAVAHEALTAGGFAFEVERLELLWRASAGLPRDSGRLRYRPARDLGPAAMLDAMRRSRSARSTTTPRPTSPPVGRRRPPTGSST